MGPGLRSCPVSSPSEDGSRGFPEHLCLQSPAEVGTLSCSHAQAQSCTTPVQPGLLATEPHLGLPPAGRRLVCANLAAVMREDQ